MKKLLSLLVILLLILSPVTGLSARAAEPAEKPIRVGYYELERFMLGAEEGKAKSGYAYDLLCEIAATNGWQYEFVYGSFGDLLDMLYAGEIDLLPCTVYTPERGEKLYFAEESIIEERYFVTALSESVPENVEISPSFLRGKRIATVADAYQNRILDEWLAGNGTEAEMLCCPSFDETWEVLGRGEADFVLNIDNAAPAAGDFTSLFEVGSSYSYMVISPERPELADGINEAIRTIRQIDPFAISHLEEKYLSGSISSTQLSDEERLWVKEHPRIKIAGFTNDIPYSFRDGNGNVTGVYTELFSMLLEQLGVEMEVEWRLYDTVEQMHDALKSGEVDMICPEYHSYYLSQQNEVIISEPVNNVPMGMLMLDDARPTQQMRVATPEARLGIDFTREFYPDAELVPCATVQECIAKVVSGEADVAIAHTTVLEEYARSFNREFNIQVSKNSCDVCFSARKEDPELIMIVDRGLRLIPSSAIEALEVQNTPANDRFTLREFVRRYLVFVILGGAAIMLLIGFTIASRRASAKLRKNVREITRQKEMIEEKEDELIVASQLANRANNAKTAFLFNMSHDIRTPMNAILGYTAMAKKRCGSDDVLRDYLGKIDIAGSNLLAIVNQVLEMSRIEAGKVELEPAPVNLVDDFNTLEAIVGSTAAAKGVTLEPCIGRIEAPQVIADVSRLNQILTNILGNAIKYTREGGRVTYSMEQKESTDPDTGVYEFVVADNGIGMSEEFVAHIFDEFSREKSSTVSGIQGTGLGMAIVKKIVDLMHGEIKVESEQDVGTTVTLRIPMTIDRNAPDSAAESVVTASPDLRGRRVLLVEDNEMNREIAGAILTEGGLTVETAGDGDIAVEKVSASAPGYYDFILMDIQMPRMNGYEATAQIRALADPALAGIPIIALSANAFEEDRRNSLEAGMNDHVSKPIDVGELFGVLVRFV